ncbi:MAG: HAMP domain-containing protein [Alphaproteobacteria bacterium]|nr:HAMP domain-containing protein [Alphaproteobacteria bacterium]
MRIGITVTLTIVFASLTLLSIGGVLAIRFASAAEETRELARERVTILSSTLRRVELHFQPVRNEIVKIAAELDAGQGKSDAERAALFAGVLAAMPQVSEIVVVRPDLQVEHFGRNKAAFRELPVNRAKVLAALDWAARSSSPRWEPVWAPELDDAALQLEVPLKTPSGFAGALWAVISLEELQRHVAELSRELQHIAFILYDKQFVVVHPLSSAGPYPSEQHPLPTITEHGDPVLTQIWDARPLRDATGSDNLDVEYRLVAASRGHDTFVYRTLDIDGGHSLTVGTYYSGSPETKEFAKLLEVAFIDFGVLLLAVAIVGRILSRPIVALAKAAGRIEQQQFDSVSVPRSRIREIDQAGQAFNQMVVGLSERQRIRDLFGKYVPNEVVERLIGSPNEIVLGGERREISLLFSDIAGFTSMSEKLPPETVLTLLNSYFEGVIQCVTRQGGIVVDFVGDAVFAIFGAPVPHADHAHRALACARAIDQFASGFSSEREAEGIPFGTTRLGIHSGIATVGSMGSPDRLKYGAAGDVVNTGSRLEGANRLFGTRILVSGETVRLAGEAQCRPLGQLVLKGRSGALEVFELLPPGEQGAAWVEDYRQAYAAIESNSAKASAELRRLALVRPDDGVIRFHLERLSRGASSTVVELTEK